MAEGETPEYEWADLWCRRQALGVSGAQMAELLGVHQSNYSGMETGKRRVPPGFFAEIGEMEHFVDEVTEIGKATAPDDSGTITLLTYDDDQRFVAAYPACAGWPALFHRVGVGRAAAALSAAGHTVRIGIE